MLPLGYKGFLRYSGGIEDTSTVNFNNIKRVYIESIMPLDIIRERILIPRAGDK
jgi:hypothetical protein